MLPTTLPCCHILPILCQNGPLYHWHGWAELQWSKCLSFLKSFISLGYSQYKFHPTSCGSYNVELNSLFVANSNPVYLNRSYALLVSESPNFMKYYYAAQLAQLPKYHATKETLLWVALEAVDCDPLTTANLLWLSLSQRWSVTNPITSTAYPYGTDLNCALGSNPPHNYLLSFLRNPSFYPTWSSLTSSSVWSNTGLIWAHHFFTSKTITPFPTLCKSHDLHAYKSNISLPNAHYPILQPQAFIPLNVYINLIPRDEDLSQTFTPNFYLTQHLPYQPTLVL